MNEQKQFYIIYRNDSTDSFVKIAEAASLKEALALRKVGGDLVVDSDYKPVNSHEWLFDWEKSNKSSYARRMIDSVNNGTYKVGKMLEVSS